MFGLASFSGAPISGYLIFEPSATVSGLQANALLNSVSAVPVTNVDITTDNIVATAILSMGSGTVTYPLKWTLINTVQYPTS